MDIVSARKVLARFLHVNHFGKESMPSIVVHSRANGFVYETPGGLTVEEAEAVTVWLREALK